MADLEFAILCAAAVANSDGTVSILSGPVDIITAPGTPIVSQLSLVLRIRWPIAEPPSEHTVRVVFATAGGDVSGEVTMGMESPEAREGQLSLATNIVLGVPILLPAYGDYTFEISIDGTTVSKLPLRATAVNPRS